MNKLYILLILLAPIFFQQVKINMDISYPSRVVVGKPVNITVTLINTGSTSLSGLILCDNVTGTCRLISSIPPNGRHTVNYAFNPSEPGTYFFSFSLEDQNGSLFLEKIIEVHASRYSLTIYPVALLVTAITMLGFKIRSKRKVYGIVLILLSLMSSLVIGFVLNEQKVVKDLSTSICTSCLGLEVESHGENVSLSDEAIIKLREMKGEVQVLIFTSKYCKACPAAKALLHAIENESNGLVKVIEVDVDKNRELAEKYEVRVVPTIVFGNYKIEGVPEDKYIVNLLVEASKGG